MRSLRHLMLTAMFLSGLALGALLEDAGRVSAQTPCTLENGDVNGDGSRNIADAVYLLAWLFGTNGPEPVAVCPTGLPDTGQSVCYDGAFPYDFASCTTGACGGQDGAFESGCPTVGRFVDNNDGTVTDTCTNLMWQQDTADTNGDGQIDFDDRSSWCDALTYCENLSLAGYGDWRLPNVRELQSIVNYGTFDPALDPVFGSLGSFYFSSTALEGDPSRAWDVNLGTGHVLFNQKFFVEFVRAVRTAH